jgi:hypothetical protein
MRRLAALIALCLLPFQAPAAHAQSDLFSPGTFHAQIDLRASVVGGEDSWLEHGFGKLREGGDNGDTEARLRVAAVDAAWTPTIAWGLSGLVSVTHQQGLEPDVDVNEAYLKFRTGPGNTRLTARAGLFWPPISLEHGGPMWIVDESITPSAINTWVGEEVKVLGAELTLDQHVGGSQIGVTGAVFRHNDTSGTLLSYRGWALHDVRIGADAELPLPPLSPMIAPYQDEDTYPFWELDKKTGYYARIEWRPPQPFAVNLFRYDNTGDRVSSRAMQTSWRTRFWNAGAVASLGERTTVKAQAMWGNTLVGPDTPLGVPVDVDFRSAYLSVGQDVGKFHLTARGDWFETKDNSFQFADDNNEDGWAAMLAAKRSFGRHVDGLVEVLHVESDRAGRALYGGIPARQDQTMVQASLRLHL